MHPCEAGRFYAHGVWNRHPKNATRALPGRGLLCQPHQQILAFDAFADFDADFLTVPTSEGTAANIFMASSVSSVSPSFTFWPTLTATLATMPGMGAPTGWDRRDQPWAVATAVVATDCR